MVTLNAMLTNDYAANRVQGRREHNTGARCDPWLTERRLTARLTAKQRLAGGTSGPCRPMLAIDGKPYNLYTRKNG
jgi:hypothetical protein